MTHLHSSNRDQIAVEAGDTKKFHCFANTTRNKQNQGIYACQKC